jgi:hypothetical protein
MLCIISDQWMVSKEWEAKPKKARENFKKVRKLNKTDKAIEKTHYFLKPQSDIWNVWPHIFKITHNYCVIAHTWRFINKLQIYAKFPPPQYSDRQRNVCRLTFSNSSLKPTENSKPNMQRELVFAVLINPFSMTVGNWVKREIYVIK